MGLNKLSKSHTISIDNAFTPTTSPVISDLSTISHPMRLYTTFRNLVRIVIITPFLIIRHFTRSREDNHPDNHPLLDTGRSKRSKLRRRDPSCSKMSCCASGDRQFQNVLLLSVSFMLVFTAFQTMGNIEQTVLKSIQKDNPGFTGDGYTSLSIIYGVFSLSNWLAPSIVAVFGSKWSMIFGATLYTAFIASFLYPFTWLLYTMSAVLGFGAAVIWTAQGNYLTLCSNEMTMSRNSGMFWAILQSSMFFGNSFVFWQFEGQQGIDQATRNLVFMVLTAVGVSGTVVMCFLRTPSSDDDTPSVDIQIRSPPVSGGAFTAFQESLLLFTRPSMILLSFTFFYTGIELSFFSGVYSTSLGFTNAFPEAKRLVGLCGILVGLGEVTGGATFGLLGSRTVKHGRDPIILLGFICHTLSYYLIFLNLPDAAPLDPTDDVSYLRNPSVLLAMLCAFLLGFGDSCYNTQIYSILGGLYPESSAPAFALFKFTQSAAAATSFYYSSLLSLRIQLGILMTFCLLGTLTFFQVEWDSVRKQLRSTTTPGESCGDEEAEEEGDKE